ncbi:MAG: hypothetical protein ACTSPD_13320 [Promethearchaeota archaeon]
MSRGLFSSLVERTSIPILPVLRLFFSDKIKYPRLFKININAYIRDIWRIRASDLKNDPYYYKWNSMTQFEKLAWNWNKQNKLISEMAKNDDNIITIHFEKIFDKRRNYIGIKRIIDFFELNEFWNTFNKKLESIFSKVINPSKRYSFPHWKKWDKEKLEKFNKIAMMKYYKYF